MRFARRFALSFPGLFLFALGPVGSAVAQLQVTVADPTSTVQGTTRLDVTVSGSGFDSTAQVKFLVTGTADPGGITVRRHGGASEFPAALPEDIVIVRRPPLACRLTLNGI